MTSNCNNKDFIIQAVVQTVSEIVMSNKITFPPIYESRAKAIKCLVKIPSNIWYTYAVTWVRIWGVKGRPIKKLMKETRFLRAAAGHGVRDE
jgi:hypothetical protein